MVYIGLVALVQQDMKKLVAYSSIAHMGFVTLGFFIFNELGVSGGIVQMISHGFVSGAMFLCIGVLYDRVHSREIAAYGGVVNTMPKFAAFAVLFAMANCGLPGTAGFVGEWMVILGTVKVNFWIAAAGRHDADLRRGLHAVDGQARRTSARRQRRTSSELTDINSREFLMLALLAVAVLWMGVYPKPFTDVMHVSVTELLRHVAQSKLQLRLSSAMNAMNWLVVYPEIVLLAMACVIALVDLCVTRPAAPPTYLADAGHAGRRSALLHLAASTPASTVYAHAGAWSSPTRWATCSPSSPRWR